MKINEALAKHLHFVHKYVSSTEADKKYKMVITTKVDQPLIIRFRLIRA